MPEGFTKSGLMVGLGESREEIMQVMDDLRAAEVDFLTIGQYLQPTSKHAKLERFWTPEEFAGLEQMARAKGFLMVSASPLTRSSYHADSDFARARRRRRAVEDVTAHRETRIVPYTADLMYAVVADVESYPEFLPWVVALRVLVARRRRARILTAEMAVGYGALRERYTSRVALDPAARTIDVVADRRALSPTLENHWRFTPERRGTRRWSSPSHSNSRAGCCRPPRSGLRESLVENDRRLRGPRGEFFAPLRLTL